MKKIIVFMFSIVLFGSCTKEGCNDPQAKNYDSSVTKDDGTCLYSVLGDWELQTYILNGDDLTSTFSDYNIHLYSDSSYLCEYLLLGESSYINTRGTFTLDDSHTEFSYENIEINSNDGNGWNPAIVTNTYSVNALTYETLNMSLISSSQPNVSSSEVIMSKI
tara:strand:+ start:312 stop:800 length:489 start_codon:yes stop_codon:yes gene_type:complete